MSLSTRFCGEVGSTDAELNFDGITKFFGINGIVDVSLGARFSHYFRILPNVLVSCVIDEEFKAGLQT